jgi:hypothetical protein
MSAPYCHIEAFINTDEFDRIPDELEEWRYRQLVSVVMLDDTLEDSPVSSALTPQQARDLAFSLLVCAEHAEQRTNSWETER